MQNTIIIQKKTKIQHKSQNATKEKRLQRIATAHYRLCKGLRRRGTVANEVSAARSYLHSNKVHFVHAISHIAAFVDKEQPNESNNKSTPQTYCRLLFLVLLRCH